MGLDNPLHILFLLLILLLVFGARRLPEIGRSLGEGMRGFKDSLMGDHHSQTLPPAAPVAQQPVQPPVQQPQQAQPAPPAPPAQPVGAPGPGEQVGLEG